MDAVTNCTRGWKKMMFAAALMLFATYTVSAQQEVAPDHFDGSEARTQTVHSAKARKQVGAHESHKKETKESADKKHSSRSVAGR
ncbi:MAG TPA: hypothetical protein VG897_11970 [Terriglobales bacterium]|nr:hypothetical protein [Terriglobales bacterium]